MRTLILISAVVACDAPAATGIHGGTDGGIDGAAADAAGELAYGEVCGNAADDDGDGLVDEDCGPRLFAGVFAPNVVTDPALAAIEGAAGRSLAVIQTYRSLAPAGVAKVEPELRAIFARGQVAHLNVEPAHASGSLEDAHVTMAAAIADALAADPRGRVLLTYGAEMNGAWTTWGCQPAAAFIAQYRAFHDHVAAALAERAIDARRVRWVFGPDARGTAGCGTTTSHYPGHAYVDLLGLSAYRSGTDSVAATVTAPIDAMFDALAYPAAWRRDRFIVLQTGSRAVTGDDRDAWISSLFTTLTDDARVAGVIYFDAADWAVPASGAGWTGLTTAIAAAPVTDGGLDATFSPHFWDVAYGDAGFAEIQALRDAAVTTGCAIAPARFCPDEPLDAAAAMTLLARAFPGATPPALAEPVTEDALASAIAALGGTPPPSTATVATRARAAVLIARGARLVPRAP